MMYCTNIYDYDIITIDKRNKPIGKEEKNMKVTQKEINERIESFLNERWFLAHREDSRPQEVSYYNGALKALELAGYDWRRDEDGEHRVFKSR